MYRAGTKKQRPNHAVYLDVLRRMSPEQRLRKSFELTELAAALLREGLRYRHPRLSAAELEERYRQCLRQARTRRS